MDGGLESDEYSNSFKYFIKYSSLLLFVFSNNSKLRFKITQSLFEYNKLHLSIVSKIFRMSLQLSDVM